MTKPYRALTGAAGALGAMLALAACASAPPPDDAMANAEVALQQAEAGGASAHSPAEIIRARQKLDDAKLALADEKYSRARRLAEESQSDSQLALAKSRAAIAEENTAAMSNTLDALREDATPVIMPGAGAQ